MLIHITKEQIEENDKKMKKKYKLLTLQILNNLPILLESKDISNDLYQIIKKTMN